MVNNLQFVDSLCTVVFVVGDRLLQCLLMNYLCRKQYTLGIRPMSNGIPSRLYPSTAGTPPQLCH